MVTVGDGGNAPDLTGYGGVDHEFKISKYEVTIGQFTGKIKSLVSEKVLEFPLR